MMDPDITILISAAENGDTDAQYQLATHYHSQGNYRDCMYWLKLACKSKHVFATTNLAICYYFGDGVDQCYEKAAPLFEQATKQGDANAKYYLGLSYLNGNGLKRDPLKGFGLLLDCANDGMPWAQLSVADCLKDGTGTPADLFEAVSWYAHAAEQGVEEAQKKFQSIYYSTHFEDGDGQQRLFWFEKEAGIPSP
jgi:uncharacterized protein